MRELKGVVDGLVNTVSTIAYSLLELESGCRGLADDLEGQKGETSLLAERVDSLNEEIRGVAGRVFSQSKADSGDLR